MTLHILQTVHAIYAQSFRSEQALGCEGNLVFTGVTHDPDTLATLQRLGFAGPESISETIMGWHHGRARATRSARARGILTELIPTLLLSLSKTASPDAAFMRFSEFLNRLPAGVQLFSLFQINPPLLSLIADIMGDAPMLADRLSTMPELLEAVLESDFYDTLPDAAQLARQLHDMLETARSAEERLELLQRFRSEKQFQAGVQMLRQLTTPSSAEQFLSDLADLMVTETIALVSQEFVARYGVINGAAWAVIALGKLGSREMAFGSDIDLVFVYYTPDPQAYSTGEKGFTASVYFNRLAQRLLGLLTAAGRYGRLYEVDTRLRPSGEQGMLAVSFEALRRYFETAAWTFEFIAFTKARVIYGGDFGRELSQFCAKLPLQAQRLPDLRGDIDIMRRRIAAQHGSPDPWDIKYTRGGLIDIDFMTQFLWLTFYPTHRPAVQIRSARAMLAFLRDMKAIDENMANDLLQAAEFLNNVFHMLRLCNRQAFSEASASPGLKALLAQIAAEKTFSALKDRLEVLEESVRRHYVTMFKS